MTIVDLYNFHLGFIDHNMTVGVTLGPWVCCITFFCRLINIAVIALLNAIAEVMSDIGEFL